MNEEYIKLTQEWHRKGFESRQAEVDALSVLGEMSEQKVDDLVLRNIELQKRIDEALVEINIYYDSDGMEDICLSDIAEILKGKEND